jgi:hypothetical protein
MQKLPLAASFAEISRYDVQSNVASPQVAMIRQKHRNVPERQDYRSSVFGLRE